MTIALLLGDTLDVDEVLQSVHRDDLAFSALVAAAYDRDFVVFAYGYRSDLVFELAAIPITPVTGNHSTYIVLLSQLLAEWCAHNIAAECRPRLKVHLSRFASR